MLAAISFHPRALNRVAARMVLRRSVGLRAVERPASSSQMSIVE